MAKLKENSGKTILMALVFLLVAIMISLVLVIAAVDSARVLNSDRKYQQAALTVTSAAELLKDSLEGNELVRTETWKYRDTDYSVLEPDGYAEEWSSSGALDGVLRTGAEHFAAGSAADYVQSFTVECGGFDTVYAEMTMSLSDTDGKYSLVLRLDLGDDAEVNYTVYIRSSGTAKPEKTEDTVISKPGGGSWGIRTKTTSISWGGVTVKGVRNSEEDS